jgi:hypothetical protein
MRDEGNPMRDEGKPMRDEGLFSHLSSLIPHQVLLQHFDNLFGERVNYAVMDFNAVTLPFNDSLVFQQRKVLGNGRLGKTEAFPDVLYITFPGTETGYNLEADRVTQYFEYFGFFDKRPGGVEFLIIHAMPHKKV